MVAAASCDWPSDWGFSEASLTAGKCLDRCYAVAGKKVDQDAKRLEREELGASSVCTPVASIRDGLGSGRGEQGGMKKFVGRRGRGSSEMETGNL